MAIVRELLVRLGVVDNTRATAAMRRFDDAAGQVKKTLTAVAAVTTAVVGGITAVAVATAKDGDQAAKGAQRTGLRIAAYQELAFAADRSGASITDLETAFKRQASSAADARNSVGTAAPAYERLNIKVTTLNGALKDQDALFMETIGALQGVTNATERAALAEDIFGRSAQRLLPLINAGADGVDALRREAQALGLVLDEDAARASEAFNDSLTDLKAIATGLRNILGAALIPVLTDLALQLKDWYLENQDLIRQRIREWTNRVVDGVTALRDVVEDVNHRMDGWENTLDAVTRGLQLFVTSLVAIRGARTTIAIVRAIQAAFALLSLPVLFVAGALASLAANLVLAGLAWEDLFTFLRGGESVIGGLLEQLGLADPILETFNALVGLIQEVGQGVLELFVALGPLMALLNEINVLLGNFFGGRALQNLQLFTRGVQLLVQGALQNMVLTLQTITALLNGITTYIQTNGGLLGAATQAVLDLTPGGGLISPALSAAGSAASNTVAPRADRFIREASSAVNTANNTYTANFNGLGMLPEQAQELFSRFVAQQQRHAMDVGGES
ncbi:MAG: hypothetical protein AAFV53_35295 [Myxococcota bacterium]